MLKKFLIIILIDIVLIALWVNWAFSIKTELMEGAIGVIFIVPVLIVLSGIVGLILQLRKNAWGQVIAINMLISLALFFGVFEYENWKQEHDNYLTFYFSDSGKTYKVILHLNKAQFQNGLTYDIYERLSEYDNAGTNLDGIYAKRNDTIFLTSYNGKEMKIFGNILFGFPKNGNFVQLRDNPH